MAHAEQEYRVIDITGELTTNPIAPSIANGAKEGWDVQTFFQGAPSGEGQRTFVLLRRRHSQDK